MMAERTWTNRCACGWETTGGLEDVVVATIDHGRRIHNMEATREQVIAALETADRGDADATATDERPGAA